MGMDAPFETSKLVSPCYIYAFLLGGQSLREVRLAKLWAYIVQCQFLVQDRLGSAPGPHL